MLSPSIYPAMIFLIIRSTDGGASCRAMTGREESCCTRNWKGSRVS